MESTIKIHNEDEDLAHFRVDAITNMINTAEINRPNQKVDYLQSNIYSINNEKYTFNQNKKNTSDTVSKPNKLSTRNCHRLIAPKLGEMNSIKSQSNFRLEARKTRDDKRRTAHNEIERRRRNKINIWIYRIKGLIPEKSAPNSSPELNCKTSKTESKSQILIRTYDYIQYMQKELKSLREYISENDQLHLGHQELYLKNNQPKNRVS